MARYTDDSRERVRDAIDFAELVGARTELKPAGPRRMTGLCPFHDERTPSFGIDPVEKLYHCFGCGAGGDVFSFAMETEGLDFGSALEWLAERAGVELERDAEDPREAERRGRRDRLLALLERTAAYYVRVLWESAEAAPAREYLAGRGLQEATLREFRVGYAPSAWDRVLTASRRAGYSEAELLAAGLVSRGREGRGVYDRFRRRITFPLADERGRVLGFGARALGADQQPKYLNTSDSELFHKGRLVYGADLARASAAKAGRIVLVEGYTDVIALRQAGVAEAVCSMGTALTDQQVAGLGRLAPTVLLCQDPDTAGQEAVAKSVQLLRRAGRVEARVVRLPPGRDPADVVLDDGADAMRALLERAVPVERFQVERVLERGELETPEGRDRVLEAVGPIIGSLTPGLLQDDLVKLVSGRLQMPESLVNQTLRGRTSAPRNGSRPHGARRDGHRHDLLLRAHPPRRPLPLGAPRHTRAVPSGRRRRSRQARRGRRDRRGRHGGRPGGAHARALHAGEAPARPPDLGRPPGGRARRRARRRAPAGPERDPPPARLMAVAGATIPPCR
jgi:DNA primase